MKKIIGIIILILLISPQINASHLDYSDIGDSRFNCSIKISGEVQFTSQTINFKVADKSIIPYCTLKFDYSSDIIVEIDGDKIDFASGGNIILLGFFGTYNVNDIDEIKTNINLDGKTLFVKINAIQEIDVDDSFISIVQSLDNITHPLDKSPLELIDEDFKCLEYLSDCKIVGLGEATHGTKEFFQLKHRIFRYLVENYGYKIFAFECDMGESYYIDNYVITGEGDIDDIMINKMIFWTWCTDEVKNLLIWMKEYNEDKADEDKIHFIGVDCQYLSYQSDVIIDYFNRSNVSISSDCLNFLNEIKQVDWNILDYFSNINLSKKEEIDQNVDKLITSMEKLKDEFISTSSEFEYQFIKRMALNIKQVNDHYYSMINENIMKRDFYMAQNTLWLNNLLNNNNKIALWAHNGHVRNSGPYSGFGSLGFHLKDELNESYQIINFAFSFGSFTAYELKFNQYILGICHISKHPIFGSMNYVFHYAEDDNFILRKMDFIDNSSFDQWISNPQKFLDIGALFIGDSHFHYFDIEFKEQFDILIYWDETLASELLNPQINFHIHANH